MITLMVTGVLLVALTAGGNVAWAGNGCGGSACGGNTACACNEGCGGQCGGRAFFHHAQFVPSITYYAVYPYWWPKYFGPPHTDYQVVQYITPPAQTALMVKERILAINAGNPALLPIPTEPLPHPKADTLPPAEKK